MFIPKPMHPTDGIAVADDGTVVERVCAPSPMIRNQRFEGGTKKPR